MTTTQPQSTSQTDAPTDSAEGRAANDLPLAVTHVQMNAAYDAGEAIPLGSAVSWLVRYRGAWWVVYERGWLRVTDNATAEDLDRAAVRLTEAQDIAARGTAARGVPAPDRELSRNPNTGS